MMTSGAISDPTPVQTSPVLCQTVESSAVQSQGDQTYTLTQEDVKHFHLNLMHLAHNILSHPAAHAFPTIESVIAGAERLAAALEDRVKAELES